MITLDEAKEYLRIDTDDEDKFINQIIETSLIFIDSMVGEEYKSNEKAVKLADLLQRKLINDMYSNRSMEVDSRTKRDMITVSILDKLSLYSV